MANRYLINIAFKNTGTRNYESHASEETTIVIIALDVSVLLTTFNTNYNVFNNMFILSVLAIEKI